MKKYLTLNRCEDEVCANILTQEQLEQKLKEEWGNYSFLKELPHDLMYFPSNSVFIMNGEVVIPKAKEVVTAWTV